jgi:catechol 2,3-dioxygenase-like lactoylglutathione lyase family enzyme
VTVTGLHHASLTVRDLERSLRFYRDALGIPVRERVDMDGDSVTAISGEPAHLRIADLDLGDGRVLELVEDMDHDPPEHSGSHLALEVDDIQAAYRRVLGAGATARSEPVELGPEAGRHWQGCTVVWITDPDGAAVELVQQPRE